MKHRPELQWHTANWRRPTRSGVRRYRWSHRNSPRAPTEPNAWGDAPPQKRNAHQWRKPSAKTRCKRGDNATGSINDTDAKKRLRARSGHSQRASAKPTAEADKATTKKERARGAQWREPRTSQDPQLQWGPPGKRAPAAAGRKAEPPTEAQTPASRKEGRVPKTTPDP